MFYDCFIYCVKLSLYFSIFPNSPFIQFFFFFSWNLAVIKSCAKRVSCRSLGSRNNPLNRSAALRCVRTSIGLLFLRWWLGGRAKAKGPALCCSLESVQIAGGRRRIITSGVLFLDSVPAAPAHPPSPLADHPLTFASYSPFSFVRCLPSLNLVNASKMLRSPGNGDATGMVLQCLRIRRNPEADEE